MNIKKAFIILFLVFIFLSGCTVVLISEDTSVRNTIQNFSLAINDQNWNKAKSYCIYGSDAYYRVSIIEDAINVLYLYCNVVTITYFVDVISVSVYGSYAEAYVHVTVLLTACGYAESDIKYGYTYLQKVGGSWKIYDQGV